MVARILVVDDEPDTLSLIEHTLRTAGYQVFLASDGKEGLHRARHEPYDLILLDIMMPDVSGFDVLRELEDSGDPHPPVVILTAMNRPEDQEKGEELGAADFLVKPITRGKLIDVIKHTLS
jgi:DNA-binding response OmpR family regulator